MMRAKNYILSLVFILLSFSVFAEETSDKLYQFANEAYVNGNYEEAISYYTRLSEMGVEAPEMYYNMGNAYFRSNKLGYAVLFYEKALKLDPGYEKAEKNLEYVSMYKEDKLEQVPEFFLKSWKNSLFGLFSLKAWGLISLVLFALLLTGILLYIYSGSMGIKKAGFFSSFAFVLLFVIAFSATLHSNKNFKHPDQAVILHPSVVVKSSPSTSGTDLFVLHEGTTLKLEEGVGEWIEIRISDGRIGWLEKKVIGVI